MLGLTSGRYNMRADVYSQTVVDPVTGDPVYEQDESGAIDRIWDVTGNPNDNIADPITIKCIARGISGGGIRVVGSTERWGNEFEDVEWVKLQTNARLSKGDRVGNIRGSNGRLAWKDDLGQPIVFDVLGATPILDPFGQLLEYDCLLQRVQ